LGIATRWTGVLPRWCGFRLVALVVLILWDSIGYALLSRRDTVVEQPSRVS
jgi:hypothetical protein